MVRKGRVGREEVGPRPPLTPDYTRVSNCPTDTFALPRRHVGRWTMLSYVLLFLGSAAVAFWAVMHLTKTRPVVAGFEPLSDDNRHVLRMEWIVEGVALLFVAALVAVVTVLQSPGGTGSGLVYAMSGGFLLTMAVVSLFTGARASLLPYELCAPIFTSAALLILIGGWAA
jgi:hypothetical protein